MTTTKMTMSSVIANTGLAEHEIRYRIKALGINPEKLHHRLFLFSEAQVKRIASWVPLAGTMKKGEGPPIKK